MKVKGLDRVSQINNDDFICTDVKGTRRVSRAISVSSRHLVIAAMSMNALDVTLRRPNFPSVKSRRAFPSATPLRRDARQVERKIKRAPFSLRPSRRYYAVMRILFRSRANFLDKCVRSARIKPRSSRCRRGAELNDAQNPLRLEIRSVLGAVIVATRIRRDVNLFSRERTRSVAFVRDSNRANALVQ